jgi:tetratricopeptide (TPR) repeat protein
MIAVFGSSGLAVILSVALSLFAFQATASQIQPITAAISAKDYDKAVELSRSALKQSPSSAQLWTLQGIALAGKGDDKGALTAFERALDFSPNNIAALEGAVQIEYQTGSPGAAELLNRLLRLRPDEPTANAMMAELEYWLGHCTDAVGHFEKAGNQLDSQPDALHAYAVCLVRLNRVDEAAMVLAKALSLRPDDPRERQVVASIQLMAKKPQDALATLQPLLISPGVDSNTLQLASSAYEETGNTPQAVNLLRQAIVLDPRKTDLYLDFANICFNHASYQVGIDMITEGLLLQPNSYDLYVARGVLYVQLAQLDKGEADFEKAYELNPDQSLSAAAQELIAVQANDSDRALASVKAKLQRKPNDPTLLYLQADLLSQKGLTPGSPEFRLAVASAKKAVSLDPTLSDARTVLVKLYMQSGQYPQAIVQCRKTLASNPDDQIAVYHLIQALRKTGQTAELPELVERLAKLREQATEIRSERSRYQLFEGDGHHRSTPTPAPAASNQP